MLVGREAVLVVWKCLLTLKIKVALPAKTGYSGIAKNCHLGHASCGKTTGMSREQGEEL